MEIRVIIISMVKILGYNNKEISPTILIEMFVIGLVTYSVIAMRQFVKIKKVPMDEVLKNME